MDPYHETKRPSIVEKKKKAAVNPIQLKNGLFSSLKASSGDDEWTRTDKRRTQRLAQS
jgi:hypothetical protein